MMIIPAVKLVMVCIPDVKADNKNNIITYIERNYYLLLLLLYYFSFL